MVTVTGMEKLMEWVTAPATVTVWEMRIFFWNLPRPSPSHRNLFRLSSSQALTWTDEEKLAERARETRILSRNLFRRSSSSQTLT